MRSSQPDEAIRLYQQSLSVDPELVEDHLGLAAAYIAKDMPIDACFHLTKYVQARPDQLVIRSRYAELLVRLKKVQQAQAELEGCIAQAQEKGGRANDHMIHCHSRLVQIAEQSGDRYREHLHRGIGLFLIAGKRSSLPEPASEFSAEGIYCKAAAELTLAQLHHPEEAQPYWYLYKVWQELGQRQPALDQLRMAQASAPFTFLTPAEQRDLQLAIKSHRAELRGATYRR
jgi:tetratricopeptide (TPR) repeat protein